MLSAVLTAHSHDTDSKVVTQGKTQAHQPAAATATAPAANDTVNVSISAQTVALKERGESVEQIAAKLNLSTSEVELDLGNTSNSTSSSATTILATSAKKH